MSEGGIPHDVGIFRSFYCSDTLVSFIIASSQIMRLSRLIDDLRILHFVVFIFACRECEKYNKQKICPHCELHHNQKTTMCQIDSTTTLNTMKKSRGEVQ